MEEKRAVEISTGRIEIITEIGRLDKEVNSESGKENTAEFETLSQCETLVEPETLPVCTRTPRMLITGKNLLCQASILYTNDWKYLHQHR